MAQSQNLQTSFASGELSPLLNGRTDLEQYYRGAQTAEGVVIVPQGGVKRRPGTEYVAGVGGSLTRVTSPNPTMPNGGTAANLNDGDDSTFGTTTAILAADLVVAHYDLTASPSPALPYQFLDVRNADLLVASGDNPEARYTATLAVEHSENNTDWTELTTAVIDNKTKRSFRFNISSLSKRYWRIKVKGPVGSSPANNFYTRIGEFGFKRVIASPTSSFLHGWEYGTDQSYLMVLSESSASFYRTPNASSTSTVEVANVVLPYTTAQLGDVKVAQTENVMLLFHEEHPPQRIITDGLDALNSFIVDPIPFVNVPQYDYNDDSSPTPVAEVQELTFAHFADGNTFQLDVGGILSKNITFAGDSTADEQASTAENIRKNLQDMPNFGNSGISVSRTDVAEYTITFDGESAQPLELLSGFATATTNINSSAAIGVVRTATGVSRAEDVWSANRGYPRTGVFYDGRLWLGGTKSKRQSIFASRAGTFFDYFLEEGDDDEAIFITIDSRGLTNIVDLNPDRGLQVFCSGAEFVVKGSTPAEIIVEQQTRHGTFGLETQSIDGATLFVDKNGKTLRQFLFNFNEDAFTSNDISVLSSQLIDQPVDMAILPGTTTDDANWVFIVNQDGTAAVLNTMRSQDINGFTRWTPGASSTDDTKKNTIKSCAVAGDQLYMISQRTPSSTAFLDIERWDFDRMLDSGVKQTVTTTGSDITLSVGSRLEGFTLGVIADGNVLPDRAVSSGNITITAAEMTGTSSRVIEYGLNFNCKVKPMPLNTQGPGGMNTMKRKKIVRMNVRVYESAGVQIDGNDVPVRKLGESEDSPLNTPYTPRTGIIQDNNGGNGWDVEVVPEINVPKGTPFHLQAIGYEVSSS